MTTTNTDFPKNLKKSYSDLSPEERQAKLMESSSKYLRGKIKLADYKKEQEEYGVDDNSVILENSGLLKYLRQQLTRFFRGYVS